MDRKPIQLIFCILFVITIISACASPISTQSVSVNTNIPNPTSTQPIATSTTIPSSTSTQPVATYTSSPSPAPSHTASPSPTEIVPVHPGTLSFELVLGRSAAEIYLIQTNGTGLRELTNAESLAGDPAWSPDGTKIVYNALGKPGEPSELWVMNADGSGQTELTHTKDGACFPAWFLDGKQVAYSSICYPNYPKENVPKQIYVMNANGSNQRRVTNEPENDLFPQWTPDGKILFLRKEFSFDSFNGDIYEINPDGSSLVRLTTMKDIGYFALSPDGTLLAIHQKFEHRIVLLPVDASMSGTPVTLVDTDFGYSFVAIAWSPDGQSLALAPRPLDAPEGKDLYVVNADGTGLTKVPNASPAQSVAWRPTVSPALDTTPSSTPTPRAARTLTPTNTPEPP